MRRLTAWIGGVAGGIAAYRFFRRHPQEVPEPASPAEPVEVDGRAEELRAKLAESRVAEPAAEEMPEPAPEPESPEERRARVHEEGRAALGEMRSDDAGG